ncbi:Adaptive-response sensory-kinase SasA [subsurface metagenome]
MNSEFEKLSGYTKRQIEGKKSWTEFVVKEDLERMKEYHRQRRTEEGAAPTNYEFRFIDRHGNIKEIFLTTAVIPGTKKSVASLLDITERKRPEEALRESEERYRSLQANIPVGIFRTTADPEGHLLSVNPALARMFGYDKPEAMSETRVADLYLNHDDRKKFVEAVSSAEAISNYEVQFKRKDGTPFWGSLNARSITDESGRVAYFDGVLEDITERKRAEETLNKRVKELNCLYGISNLVEKPDITLEEIIQGTVNLIPPSWQYPDITCARIIIEGKGYTTENFRETEWVQTADVTTHGRRAGTVEVYYLEERPQSDEGPFLKEERHLLYAIAKRLGKIAERKRAEEALRKEKEKAQSYLDIAGVMFVVIGSDKKVSLINKRGGEILGYKEEDIVGKNWFDNFLPERIRENIKARFDVLMAREKEPDPYFENPILTKDGEERIILWHNTILTDDSGKIIGTLCSGEDITERKQYFSDLNEYSKALESLLKERSEFFSMASHELRTPITVVNGYLDIMERNLENMDSTQIHKAIKKMIEHSERLTLLVETLLDISKIEDSKSILSSEVCEIEPIVKRALNLCEHQAQEKQIACHFEGFDCEDGKPCVIGDALAIENVLLNILGNAIKYSSEGSEVIIRCDTEDDTLRLDCIDQGIGLPPGVEKRIFEEFYRVEQGGELKKSGTGLGLSIAKRLVERMGGRIWAHSEGLNEGTTVSFTLPLAKSENLAEKE